MLNVCLVCNYVRMYMCVLNFRLIFVSVYIIFCVIMCSYIYCSLWVFLVCVVIGGNVLNVISLLIVIIVFTVLTWSVHTLNSVFNMISILCFCA